MIFKITDLSIWDQFWELKNILNCTQKLDNNIKKNYSVYL